MRAGLMGLLSLCLGHLAAFAAAFSAPALAAIDPVTNVAEAAQVARDLSYFVDGVWRQQRAQAPMAGMTIAVVKQGEVVLLRGYGLADIEMSVPVDPAVTQFRIGSVSKTWVWLSVLKLVNEKRVDLNTDVQTYLGDFRLPTSGDGDESRAPITLLQLLTHSAGFDEQVVELFSRDPKRAIPLEERLGWEMPPRVRKGGDAISYSNHGTALAALVVEKVTQRNFADYVQENFLQPLQMTHTSLQQPPSPDRVAIGYRNVAGALVPQAFEVVPIAAIGGVSSTAADMSRYMIEWLSADGQVITPALKALAMQPVTVHHPQATRGLHGLYEFLRTPRALGHSGDTLWFHSEMRLFPEQNIGIFVSYNSDTGARGRSEMMEAVTSFFFPLQPTQALMPTSMADLDTYVGWYSPIRTSETTLARISGLVGAFNISAESSQAGQAYLQLRAPQGKRRFLRQTTDFFREVDGRGGLIFTRDQYGDVERLIFDGSPVVEFRRLQGLQSPPMQFLLLGFTVLGLVVGLIAIPVASFRHRHDAFWQGDRWTSLAAWLGALALLGVLLALMREINELGIAFGEMSTVRRGLWLALIAIPLVALGALGVIRAYWQKRWNPSRRILTMITVVCAITLLLFLNHYNLVGFHYPTDPKA